jgi:hypothetical protein
MSYVRLYLQQTSPISAKFRIIGFDINSCWLNVITDCIDPI